ncbi:MAG: chromosomal replication initiator protein DnaA, partial [Planctomycetota bacterium]
MNTDGMEIVSTLRAALAEKVGPERFELWFGASTRLELSGRTLTVGVPNAFFLEWVRTNFRRAIEAACLETLGHSPALKFRIDSSLPNPDVEPTHPDGTRAAIKHPALANDTASAEGTAPKPAAGDGPVRSTRRKFASLGSFVPGRTNGLALASAEAVARRPGEMTPLLIYGPTSVGKTHLLEGIWTAARKSHRQITAIYLSAEQFTTYFLEALRGSGLPSFRRKYRGVDLLILDDLQFLAGKRATQVELLHTADTLLRQGRQLVFAADRSPAELAELLPELTTRLEGGMVCRIEPPDYATRLGILAQMAARRQLDVPPEVQRFIASRLTNHARELSGALCRLQATGEVLRRPITLGLAEEALAEMIRHSAPVVRLPDIERAVCDVFGVEPASLHSTRKAKRVSHPRMLAMWLARKHTRAALSEIGEFFGRRSHSTVLSAQKRVGGWMAAGESLVLAEQTWDVDEAIRQVEQKLRAS